MGCGASVSANAAKSPRNKPQNPPPSDSQDQSNALPPAPARPATSMGRERVSSAPQLRKESELHISTQEDSRSLPPGTPPPTDQDNLILPPTQDKPDTQVGEDEPMGMANTSDAEPEPVDNNDVEKVPSPVGDKQHSMQDSTDRGEKNEPEPCDMPPNVV